jgi:hypothetical protein
MATANRKEARVDDPGALRDEWLGRLSELTKTVRGWAEELDWSTRQIGKRMKDSRLGSYEAPALLMQKGTTRVLLDPVARFTPGTDGVVDLYLMPAYDDIASLSFVQGEWRLHFMYPRTATVARDEGAKSTPLSKETLGRILDEMSSHAASSL